MQDAIFSNGPDWMISPSLSISTCRPPPGIWIMSLCKHSLKNDDTAKTAYESRTMRTSQMKKITDYENFALPNNYENPELELFFQIKK